MSTCLILGYGNPLRSDDGVGQRAAAALEAELLSAEVRVIAAHQLTPEMAEQVAGASRVLFLDATHGGVPGEIRCERVARDRHFEAGSLSHHLSPAALLEVAARYFQAEPQAWLLTITGENFEAGESFSAPVTDAWSCYLERVRTWVRAL